MLTTVQAGPYRIRGISVGGIYTSLEVRELGVLLDAGIAPRSFAPVDDLFLSHGHADHVGALGSLLGIRGLMRKDELRIYMPAPIVDSVCDALRALSRLQRYDLAIVPIAMEPGDERQIRADLWVRAFRTYHPVPSLGYQFFRRVQKLKRQYADLPGPEIGARRKRGDDLFEIRERLELAYATDTLVRVLDESPSILASRVLVLECSFLDERKSLADSRAGCHIHLDELLDRAERFACEHLVLMHFSQIYRPREVHEILARRCPPSLLDRLVVFAPHRGAWPG